MTKCSCYSEQEKRVPIYDRYTGIVTYYEWKTYGYCNGTKEREECSCCGDKKKCTFYHEVREKAEKENQKIPDEQELKLLRKFLKEYDMIWEFTSWVERNK